MNAPRSKLPKRTNKVPPAVPFKPLKKRKINDKQFTKLGMRAAKGVPFKDFNVKREKLCSKEEAYAKCSSIAPTRLALTIDWPTLTNLIRYFAVMTSYHLQSVGIAPKYFSEDATGWNPSMVYAYYMAIVGNKLATSGALQVSSELLPLTEHFVPVFFGKWLQQIGNAKHMGREIVNALNGRSLSDFYTFNCGNGGIPSAGAQCSAPCSVPVNGDTEGYWSVDNNSDPVINAGTLQATQFSALSSFITRGFKHTVMLKDIPKKAKNCELKMTPVADGIEGQLMFSCVDDKLMCDLILPLAAFYEPTLLNSMCPVQVAAPVRMDAGLVMCQESKLSFLFWLANQFPWDPKDTFRKYLNKFGVQENHMANLQLNLRQINFTALCSMVISYMNTLCPTVIPDGAWYMINYINTILVSSIPGCFRAFSPIAQNWNIAPTSNKANPPNPMYSALTNRAKIPNFVAQVVEALKKPIRTANQITFFICSQPSGGGTDVWWQLPTATNSGTMSPNSGVNYGKYQQSMWDSGLSWVGGGGLGNFLPYPGWVGQAAPVNGFRNQIVLRGLGPQTGWFQKNLTMVNGGQNLWNQLQTGSVKFTKRVGKYYIRSQLGDVIFFPEGPNVVRNISGNIVVPTLIASWEASGHHAALLAIIHPWTYLSPSDFNIPTLAATFSSTPATGVTEAAPLAYSAANPGQGTPQQIELAKSANPQDVAAHMAAESVSGALADQTKQIADEQKKHVEEEVKKISEDMVKGTVNEANKLVQDFTNAL